jgi:hypothetical protein
VAAPQPASQVRAAYGIGMRVGHTTPERVLHSNLRLLIGNLLKISD